jgi:two-component system LytT family response regulator
MIRAIIIDDEPYCCEALATLLEDCCSEVQVLGSYHDGIEGMSAIRQLSPDLVFLDVEMPENGFDMPHGCPPLTSRSSLPPVMINMH